MEFPGTPDLSDWLHTDNSTALYVNLGLAEWIAINPFQYDFDAEGEWYCEYDA